MGIHHEHLGSDWRTVIR